MQLRATRYLKDCRAPDEFGELVKDVRGFSFQNVCKFYEDFVPSLTDAEQALLACNDRFFLLTEVLGRKSVNPSPSHPWVYERIREVEAKPDSRVDLWAREHFKTSGITVAGIIQEIMCDPEVTVGLFSVVEKAAQDLVAQIMGEFESNLWLRRIFPDVLWERPKIQASVWGKKSGLTVKRQGNPREPTLSGWGLINAMPTGYHFKLRVYDDVINEKHQNAEQCQKALERFEMSDNLSSGEGRFWVIGTRYFQGDPYETMIDRGVVTPRVYPATDNGKIDGNPVFWTKQHWENKKKTQRSTTAAQLLQNPLADGQAIFDPLTLRPYTLRPRTLNVYILGDYAGSKSKTSDRTAFAVIGVDAAGSKYFLDGYCHRMSLTEKWECLSSLYTKWRDSPGVQFVRVGYERYGANSDIQYFEREMLEKDAPKFPIEELNYAQELNNQSKRSRVARLEPDFTNNAFFMPAKVWRANASWWIAAEEWTDPKTGKRYGVGQEVPGPMPDEAKGQSFVGPRVCLWSVDKNNGQIIYRPIPMEDVEYWVTLPDGKQEKRRKSGAYLSKDGSIHPGLKHRRTSSDMIAINAHEPYRIVSPIKKTDSSEPPSAYDLTHIFFEEFKAFPKSNLRDLIDATSRIYDIDPLPPIIISDETRETPEYDD